MTKDTDDNFLSADSHEAHQAGSLSISEIRKSFMSISSGMLFLALISPIYGIVNSIAIAKNGAT